MSASKVLLILGSGGNIGASVAELFSKNGYNVGMVARRLKDEENQTGQLHIQGDLSDPASVKESFAKVTRKFGPPNVVVYNAASAEIVPAASPLDLSVEGLTRDFVVNSTSVLAAAKEAVQGFEQLPSPSPKVFIYTGNFLNKYLMPALVSNGMGKSATGHLLAVAAQAYGPKGYCFYFADERKADGNAAFRDINGPSSAKHYLELAESKEQKPWLQTFVGGLGYKDFSDLKL